MDITTLQGVVSSLNTASNILKSIKDFRKIPDLRAKITELEAAVITAHESALSAQLAQSAMIDEIRNLKEKMAEMETWDTEKTRYQLKTLWEGAVVYALKESMKGVEPPHYICTNCYDSGRKSILNLQKKGSGFIEFVCPACNACLPSVMRHSKGFPLNYV